jgi:hypothetical protein
VDCSVRTVRHTLKEAGLKAGSKKNKPQLLEKHYEQRRTFALKHRYWTVEDWKRVVWSDETKVNRVGFGGREWVWKRPGSAITEQHVKGKVKFGGGGLMMWGCMTAQGVGYACRINGGLDGKLYECILDDEFLKTLEDYGLEMDEIIFQHDNDSKHTSNIARQWFKDKGVKVLKWPSRSPDLNPIEDLWHRLKQQLAAYPTEARNIDELWERVQVEWEKILVHACVELIESMPKRIAAVRKAKGGYTKY